MNLSRSYFKKKYFAFRQALTGPGAQFTHVELLSYHAPKTAGTSLFLALQQAYGFQHIQQVYDATSAKPLTKGIPLWVPPKTLVIHGHFRPNPKHIRQYPKAKRIVWVRDPIERCWSFLRHWLTVEDDPLYDTFKAKHMRGEERNPAVLFDRLVHDDDFKNIRLFYQSFHRHMAPNHFDFVGKTEAFETELPRLAKLLNKPLIVHQANENMLQAAMPFAKSDYKEAFRSEYEFLAKTFNIHYAI